MTNKKFAGQVTLLLLVNVFVKLIWIFFIERKVQLSVGFAQYGTYYSILNYTLILSIINDPGLNNFLINQLSKDKSDVKQISGLLYLKIILSILYLVITLVGSFILGLEDYQLVFLLIMYQIGYSLLTYFRSFLKGHQLLNIDVIFSVLDKSILIVFFIPLLYLNTAFIWTIKFYAIAQLLAVIISLLICIYYLNKRKISVFVRKHILFDFQLIKSVFPFAVFAFLVVAYNRVDVIMLDKILDNGAHETGVYAAAYRFLDAATMFSILFASFLYPVIGKLINNKKQIEVIVKQSFVFLVSASLILAFASWFYRNPLMQLFYLEKATENLALIFGVLMFCLPLIALYYVFSTLFTAKNSLKLLNFISAMGLLINVGLNLLLIPNYQALGAALSSLLSFAIVGLLYSVLYYTYFKYSFEPIIWIKLLLYAGLLCLLGSLLTKISINWVFSLVIYFSLSTIVGVFFRFFDVKKIRKMIS
ncbi:oligosaccharide flippase family protein [Pedobacter alpinus]|uniref:Oligosaccharide flippase family protein n=1 Tax=Pedobacter alpinus TaxID=1590643 RepID=A0ABW5TP82_9SPHI